MACRNLVTQQLLAFLKSNFYRVTIPRILPCRNVMSVKHFEEFDKLLSITTIVISPQCITFISMEVGFQFLISFAGNITLMAGRRERPDEQKTPTRLPHISSTFII